MAACKAALNIKGEHFPCDIDTPHPGLPHGNKDAEAIWCSDEEAKKEKEFSEKNSFGERMKAKVFGKRVQ